MQSKEEMVKEIISIRRRLSKVPAGGDREIEVFEAQLEKSLRRVEGASYIAKKFDRAELEKIKEAYEALRK